MNQNVSYTRRSLAQMYFPELEGEQAVRRLTGWIKKCKPLCDELTKDGKSFHKRQFLTIREVRLIMEYLGEPD